jgi:hypothetical protein
MSLACLFSLPLKNPLLLSHTPSGGPLSCIRTEYTTTITRSSAVLSVQYSLGLILCNVQSGWHCDSDLAPLFSLSYPVQSLVSSRRDFIHPVHAFSLSALRFPVLLERYVRVSDWVNVALAVPVLPCQFEEYTPRTPGS